MLNYNAAYALALAAVETEARSVLSPSEIKLVEYYNNVNELGDYEFNAYDTADYTFLVGDDGDFFLIDNSSSKVFYVETEGSCGLPEGLIREFYIR